MTATHRHHDTPDSLKGQYVVARFHADGNWDYLTEFSGDWGAIYAGVTCAKTFDSKSEAVRAAIAAHQTHGKRALRHDAVVVQ